MKIYKVAPMRRVTDSKGVCHFAGDVVDVNDPLVKTQMAKVVECDEPADAPKHIGWDVGVGHSKQTLGDPDE